MKERKPVSSWFCRFGFHVNETINERVSGTNITTLIETDDGESYTEHQRIGAYLRSSTRCYNCGHTRVFAITTIDRPEEQTIMNQKCNPVQQVERFNAQHPIGQPVKYYPIRHHAPYHETKTTGKAYVLSGHTAVVTIEGQAGCVALANIEVIRTR